MDADLRRITEETYRKRGGMGQTLPGFAVIAGRGRVDLRFAQDNDGELYILTKSDGMIRKVVGAKGATTTPAAANVSAGRRSRNDTGAQATTLRNPVAFTAASVTAGKRVFNANCSACHGNRAQGAVRAGITISIIEEQRGKQPPDLTDAQWDHGSSDADIFRVIKRGLPPTMMPGFDGRVSDREIWNIANYLRSLRSARGKSQ
jgi:mono/diheme cytochrome c family protein